MKRIVAGLASACIATGAWVPTGAYASPSIEGGAAASAGVRFGCEGAYCASFRAAGCPDAMASPYGSTTSIVDVSDVGGRTLTFSWSDAGMRLYDAGLNKTGMPISRMYFYRLSSCADPVAPLPIWFVLDTRPTGRSAEVTIPRGTKWLIAEPLDNAAAVSWSAR